MEKKIWGHPRGGQATPQKQGFQPLLGVCLIPLGWPQIFFFIFPIEICTETSKFFSNFFQVRSLKFYSVLKNIDSDSLKALYSKTLTANRHIQTLSNFQNFFTSAMLLTPRTIICQVWYECNMFEILLLILSNSTSHEERMGSWIGNWFLIHACLAWLGPRNIVGLGFGSGFGVWF